ncbi:fimbrial protein [Metakosakonia massiliensis]|uniref:Fimbrial-type adhesion domain-containing protein n=2 Tax=Phytobacter massiliensis TaxID=1485952 RepID=A0A6N3HQW3_9ENTR
MRKITSLLIVYSALYLFSADLFAGELDITTVNPARPTVMTLLTSQKITLGNSIPNCTMIGGYIRQNVGSNVVDTHGRSAVYYLSMQKDVTSGEEVCAGQYANYKIYKTTVDGIGISYNDADPGSQSRGKIIPLWPQLIPKSTYSGSSVRIDAWVDIRLWKYSSAPNTLPAGLLDVKGPMIVQVVGPVAGDTLNTCSTDKAVAGTSTVCFTDRRVPVYMSTIYASTCEFVNASKTVQMGARNIPPNAAQGYGTPWVDASFQLRCPDAWGYSSDVANISTITPNNGVMVTVQPYDGFVDASNGIIKLDGSGAQGVGIQLAWGDYTAQGAVPAKPVKLNTPTCANTISSNFSAAPYAIGSNPASGDGTINMAARYIRTTGTLQPGPANAKVEILANYQ